MGQRTQTFYRPPGEGTAGDYVEGYYAALLDARHTFEFVHEDDLSPETLRRFDALILPNVAFMSDAQCRQIEAYSQAGGSVLADFETSLFDEKGRPRPDFGLAKLFGMSKAGGRVGSRGFENSFYARIEKPHEILRGFTDTNWTAGCEWRVQVKAEGEPVMTTVGPYPAYPTEVVYTGKMHTDEPAIVLRVAGPAAWSTSPATLAAPSGAQVIRTRSASSPMRWNGCCAANGPSKSKATDWSNSSPGRPRPAMRSMC